MLAVANKVNAVNQVKYQGMSMNTKDKILQAARKEFVKRGFQNASMRNIASEVGISAAALYKHYENKEMLFEAVVEPAVKAWDDFAVSETERQTDNAWKNGLEAMWNNNEQTKNMVDLVYGDFELQKLLFCSSEGTKYSDFMHVLVMKVQDATLSFTSELRKRGAKINDFDHKEMHMLLSSQYSILLEMVRHNYTYEEAKRHTDTISEFFKVGWRYFLGF